MKCMYKISIQQLNKSKWILTTCQNLKIFTWHNGYEFFNFETLRFGNFFTWHTAFIKVIKISTIKVRMFDGVVRILTNVKHIPKLRRSLISLGVVDTLGYDFSIKNGSMSINKGTLITMN